MSALYGDDGELQCGQCRTDFKREPFADLRAKTFTMRLAATSEALKADKQEQSRLSALVAGVQQLEQLRQARLSAERVAFGPVKIVHAGRAGAELQAVLDAVDRLIALRIAATGEK